jgi:hypothetical protein
MTGYRNKVNKVNHKATRIYGQRVGLKDKRIRSD